MTRTILLLILALFLVRAGEAQTAPADSTPVEDVLYLRDGSVFRGQMLYYIQGKQVGFRLHTGDEIVVTQRHIRRIVQVGVGELEEAAAPGRERSYAFRERGFYAGVQGGMAFGRTSFSNKTSSWGLQVSAGHLWRRYLGFGGGIGMEPYEPASGQIVYPLFAEARGYLSSRWAAPFYALRAGYGLVFRDRDLDLRKGRGGMFLNPALGVRWGASAGINVTTEMGLQFQRAQFTYGEIETVQDNRDLHFRRMTLRIGVLF